MATTDGQGLASLVLFEHCTDDELRRIAAIARRRPVAAGDVVIEAGQQVTDLLLVLRGTVAVSAAFFDGTLSSGDLVGEISALSGEPATATVTATEAGELVAIPIAFLPQLLAMDSVGPRLRAIANARLGAGSLVTAASVPVIRRAPRVRGVGAGLDAGSRARPVRSVVLGTLLVAVASGSIWFVSQRNKATVVDVSDVLALAQAPADDAFAPPPSPEAPPAGTPTPTPTSEPGAEDDAPTRAPSGAPAPTEPANPDSTQSPVPATSAPPPPPPPPVQQSAFRPPTPGVYAYATTGSERISVAGATHQYPEETYAVVRTGDGCGWTLEHYVLEEHVDRRALCSSDAVTTLRFETEITFFGQTDGLLYVCDPPAVTYDGREPPGRTGTCQTEDGGSDIDYDGLFVGMETLDVGGDQVEVAHLEIDFTMTGDARGTSHLSQWIEPSTGLIVRMERQVDTRTSSVWGDVRYQEDATFHLRSMTPQQ